MQCNARFNPVIRRLAVVPPSPDEDHKQRIDRELIELLNELRVALPGVQVLFAFLLTLPFAKGFTTVTGVERGIYFAAVLATTLSTALLIAPTSFHRLRFRARDKERLIEVSNKLTIVGLGFLAVAINCAVFLISDYVFNLAVASVVTAATVLVFAWLWYLLPLTPRHERGETGTANKGENHAVSG